METWIFYILLGIAGLIILSGIKIIDQYERGVILTLGTFTGVLNPGLKIVIPFIQRLIRVDLRITTADIPQQEVITKDNVPVGINAVVYFQVEKPEDAVLKIQDYAYAVTQYSQTALRDVIGGVELDTLLTEREQLAEQIKTLVERERRATIIRAQGELSASENLKKAMQNMSSSGAISLRTLQTIEATTANPANTIVFALPTEVLSGLKSLLKK